MATPTSPALRRALLATLLLCMVGCKDLKIQTQNDAKEFRFGQKNEMWLTFKKKVVEPTPGVSISWSSDKQGVLSNDVRLDLSVLRPGSHKITARCQHDGKKEQTSKAKKIKILNDVPVPSISSPGAQAKFGVGTTVYLQGTATDREDGDVPSTSIRWEINGRDLGSGDTAEATNLQPGFHTITMIATDAAGATGTSTRLFEVTNQAPEVTLTAPTGSIAPINVLDTFDVAATATDPDPVNGSASLTEIVWTSNLHPGEVLGTGANATLSNLNGGTHTIRATAKDEFGTPGSASFQLVVSNQDPTVEILAPNSNSFYSAAATVEFEAQASDPEAAIDENNVVWGYVKGGSVESFGTGLKYSTDDLKPGTHVIRVTVTDAHGGTDSDEITLLIQNEKPEPVIVRPGPHASRTFNFGDTIRLVGEATDAEDGQVADSGLEWSWKKIDGSDAGKTGKFRSSGGSISPKAERLVNRAGFGTFEITLTATDSDGASESSQTRRFKVENQRAEVRLTAPTANATSQEGQAIQFSAVATDPDTSGFLNGSQFRWVAKELATGAVTELEKGDDSFSSAVLTAGRYEITVIVTDPQAEDVKVRATTQIVVTPAPAVQPQPTTPAPTGTPTAGIADSVNNGNN